MNASSRYLAFFAYLLSLPGALFVLIARRRDAFAIYHARQSLVIALVLLLAPLLWAVVAWVVAWVPYAGPPFAVLLFALVLAVYVGMAFDWISGMIYALRGQTRAVALTGHWAARLPSFAAAPITVVEPSSAQSP